MKKKRKISFRAVLLASEKQRREETRGAKKINSSRIVKTPVFSLFTIYSTSFKVHAIKSRLKYHRATMYKNYVLAAR